ncbi:family 4 carbohydrate esterase, partial [Cryphonectria parasitica EP155]
ATLPRPELGSVPYGQIITSCSVPGTVALTFDDGPWRYTSDLLDLLEREEARATFFVCGGNMADAQLTGYGHPRLLRRMLAAGHQVGSHTWAHPDLATTGEREARRQMWRNEQALVGILGLLPTYFRPPYLSWAPETLDLMAVLGYHVVSLDVDTRDWEGDYDAARRNFETALEGLDPDSSSRLVLAHDIHERTVYELAEFMITEAREKGYDLVTVGECLGDERKNWYR